MHFPQLHNVLETARALLPTLFICGSDLANVSPHSGFLKGLLILSSKKTINLFLNSRQHRETGLYTFGIFGELFHEYLKYQKIWMVIITKNTLSNAKNNLNLIMHLIKKFSGFLSRSYYSMSHIKNWALTSLASCPNHLSSSYRKSWGLNPCKLL